MEEEDREERKKGCPCLHTKHAVLFTCMLFCTCVCVFGLCLWPLCSVCSMVYVGLCVLCVLYGLCLWSMSSLWSVFMVYVFYVFYRLYVATFLCQLGQDSLEEQIMNLKGTLLVK